MNIYSMILEATDNERAMSGNTLYYIGKPMTANRERIRVNKSGSLVFLKNTLLWNTFRPIFDEHCVTYNDDQGLYMTVSRKELNFAGLV